MGIRRLTHGDEIPDSEPRRYSHSEGYVVLRWKVGVEEYVEAFEHRVVMGLPPPHLHVHHRDGDKTNNSPDNLELMSVAEHSSHHAEPKPTVRWRRRNGRRALRGFPRHEAAQLYREGWSTTELADRYGVDASNISRGLRARGVEMRPPGSTTDADPDDIVWLYTHYVGGPTICDLLGCSDSTVKTVLRQRDIPIRGPGRLTSDKREIRREALAKFSP